jgi:5'-deoxynucleotidase YfbR-like HD superfamily hydrolase
MTVKPTHYDIEKLIKGLVLPFCHVKRDMPLPVGERRWENDAEHSWSVAFLACTLAPKLDPSLDISKICQFAVVHDLVEVYATDTSTFADHEHLATKVEREEQALKRISSETTQFPWIAETIEAYERQDTPEAKFVSAIDKYIAVTYDLIDEGKLFRERKMSLEEYNKSLESQRRKVQDHPLVAEYYEEVRTQLDAHPEFFHQPVSA